MPLHLHLQAEFRIVQRLQFCYLCGHTFAGCDVVTMDHVPPKKLFRECDRTPPLQLPTHDGCNHGHSENDAVSAQLIDVLHGVGPTQQRFKAGAGTFRDGTPGVAITGFDMRALVRRWVRGFHAALYAEYQPDNGTFSTTTPLPEGDRQPDGSVSFAEVAATSTALVREIKRNRAVSSLDRITAYNGKCRFECVWTQADRGEWFCIWALDIYDWIKLGDGTHFAPRGCFGAYRREGGGTPFGASEASALDFKVPNAEPLDPYGA